MIDYKKINKEISQQKLDRIHNKKVDEFTCNYDPYHHHGLCPHQTHCILNNEFNQIHAKLSDYKNELKVLEEIYEESLELKKEFPERDYESFFVGFNPKQNRIRRKVLKKCIRDCYNELRKLKTKRGGYK